MMKNKKIISLHSTHSAFRIPHSETGFTLIEIAMVLVLLGILITLGIGLVGPLTKRTKLIESREVVKTAKEALSGYAVKYGYLPATDIGLSGARTLDAWGRSLVYALPASLSGSGNACGLTATDRTIYECTNATCSTSNTKPNIAFIVYSTGEDADGLGTTTKPTAAPACPAGTCYWIREQATSDASYALPYDDIVQYATLDEIRAAMGCSFNITTQTLPDAKVGTAYNVTGVQLQASGGQTPYASWSTGQAQGACAVGSVRLVASDIGLCLNTTSGLISETPTTAGVYNFTLTLTDANAVTTSKAFTLNVIETLAITNQTLPDARTGDAYSVTLNGTGGVAPYTWSTGQAQGACAVGSVRLVASDIGLCLNTTSGLISGTPTTAGVYNFTLTLTDANSKTTTKAFTLNVLVPCGFSGINVRNLTGGTRYYSKNGGACTTWTNNTTVNLLPTDYLNVYTNAACTTSSCTTYPIRITYSLSDSIDVNTNCAIRLTATAATCAFSDE